ncbi:hypothetical protein HDU76_009242, partial [Blyttiomyces sp. JEL0837]
LSTKSQSLINNISRGSLNRSSISPSPQQPFSSSSRISSRYHHHYNIHPRLNPHAPIKPSPPFPPRKLTTTPYLNTPQTPFADSVPVMGTPRIQKAFKGLGQPVLSYNNGVGNIGAERQTGNGKPGSIMETNSTANVTGVGVAMYHPQTPLLNGSSPTKHRASAAVSLRNNGVGIYPPPRLMSGSPRRDQLQLQEGDGNGGGSVGGSVGVASSLYGDNNSDCGALSDTDSQMRLSLKRSFTQKMKDRGEVAERRWRNRSVEEDEEEGVGRGGGGGSNGGGSIAGSTGHGSHVHDDGVNIVLNDLKDGEREE